VFPKRNGPFAGISILLFGDKLQLPPVKKKFIYEDIDSKAFSLAFSGAVPIAPRLMDEFRYTLSTQIPKYL
jgi:hypothetical protein